MLQVARNRINQLMKGSCAFVPMGLEKVRVNVDMNRLFPAVPGLILTDVETREGVLLLKAGRP